MQMNKGFTATELIVVIVILGLLAVISVSRFNAYLAKGRQAEAKVNLTTIGALQETWKFGHGKYNDGPGGTTPAVKGVGEFGLIDRCNTSPDGQQMKNALGFRPKDCNKLRYGYNWTGGSSGSATATSSIFNEDKYIYPGCKEIDTWTLTYSTGGLDPSDPDVIEKCTD